MLKNKTVLRWYCQNCHFLVLRVAHFCIHAPVVEKLMHLHSYIRATIHKPKSIMSEHDQLNPEQY